MKTYEYQSQLAQTINRPGVTVSMFDRIAAWSNNGVIETMEFPDPTTIWWDPTAATGDRPSVYADYVVYQSPSANAWSIYGLYVKQGPFNNHADLSQPNPPFPNVYNQSVWYEGPTRSSIGLRYTYALHDQIGGLRNFGGICNSYRHPKGGGGGTHSSEFVIFHGVQCGQDGSSVLYLYAPYSDTLYKVDEIPLPDPNTELIWHDVLNSWVTYTDSTGQIRFVEIDTSAL
jgi:hypothetical protein